MEFCDKLVYLMAELNIKSAELARRIPVDPALVSRWRTGQRVPKDQDTIHRIALHIVESARTDREKSLLADLVSEDQGDNLNTAEQMARWLFNGRGVKAPTALQSAQAAGVCFAGAEGFLTAVSMLEYAVRQRISRPELSVYISTEQVELMLDARVGSLWERLYLLNSAPVPVILEQSLDAARLSVILSALLPHIQSGRLLLYHLPAAQRQFCYTLTILAKGICMVMAMEPPGVRTASVSLFVDQPSFVSGVGAKLAELQESARPMLRRLRDPADERVFFKRFFCSGAPVSARFDTVNLLYAEPNAYKELLMANGVPYESRRWRIAEFSAMRSAFEDFLSSGQYRELASLAAIDGLAHASPNTVPELHFIERETLAFPPAFVKSLLKGMVDFSTRFPGLEITLTRRDRGTCVTRIREDRLLLLQDIVGGQSVSLSSENWLTIHEYAKDFNARWSTGEDIFGKGNVRYALTRRLDKLEESE